MAEDKMINTAMSLADGMFDDVGSPTAEDDYTLLPPEQVLQNGAFLNDAQEYYRQRDGKEFQSQEELLEYFWNDRAWRNMNSISSGMDVANSFNDSDDQNLRLGRLQKVYQNQPNFWNREGGWEYFAKNILPAVLLDPVNLLGAGSGKVAATAAMKAAHREAIKRANALTRAQLKRKGIAAGAKRGAIVEGAINAPIEAGFDIAHQTRDVNVGIQDEYSPGQTVGAAVMGGVAGGALGGAFGAGGGMLADATKAQRLADIEELADGAEPTAGRETPEEHDLFPETTPEEPLTPTPAIDEARLEDVRLKIKSELDELMDGRAEATDPAQVEKLAKQHETVQRMEQFPAYREQVNKQIAELSENADEASRATVAKLRQELVVEEARYDALTKARSADETEQIIRNDIDPQAVEVSRQTQEAPGNETLRTEGATEEAAAPAPEAAQIFDNPDPAEGVDITDEGLETINARALELSAGAGEGEEVLPKLRQEFGETAVAAWAKRFDETKAPSVAEVETIDRVQDGGTDEVVADLQRERANAARRGDEDAVRRAEESIEIAQQYRPEAVVHKMPEKIEVKKNRAAFIEQAELNPEDAERRVQEVLKSVPGGKGKQARMREATRKVLTDMLVEKSSDEFVESASSILGPDYKYNSTVMEAYVQANPDMAAYTAEVLEAQRRMAARDALDEIGELADGLDRDQVLDLLVGKYGDDVALDMAAALERQDQYQTAEMSNTHWRRIRGDQKAAIEEAVKRHRDAIRIADPDVSNTALNKETARFREALKDKARDENSGLIDTRSGNLDESDVILSDEIVTDKDGNAFITEGIDPHTGKPTIKLLRKTVTGRQILRLPGGKQRLGRLQSAIRAARWKGVDGEYKYNGSYLSRRLEEAAHEQRSSWKGEEGAAIPVRAEDIVDEVDDTRADKKQKKFLVETLSKAQKELLKAQIESTQIHATRLKLNDIPEAKVGTNVPFRVKASAIIGNAQLSSADKAINKQLKRSKEKDVTANEVSQDGTLGTETAESSNVLRTADGVTAHRDDVLWYDPTTELFYHNREYIGFEPHEIRAALLEEYILDIGPLPNANTIFMRRLESLRNRFGIEVSEEEVNLATQNILDMEAGMARDAEKIDAVIEQYQEDGDIQALTSNLRRLNREAEAEVRAEKMEATRKTVASEDSSPRGIDMSDEELIARFEKVAAMNKVSPLKLAEAMTLRSEDAHASTVATQARAKMKNPENFDKAAERYMAMHDKGMEIINRTQDDVISPEMEVAEAPAPVIDTTKPVKLDDLKNIEVPEGYFDSGFDTSIRNVEDLYRYIEKAENAAWPRDINGLKEHVANLSTLYDALEIFVPEGVKLPNSRRWSAVRRLETDILKKHGVETIANARDLLRRLGGDQTIAPTIRLGEGNGYHAATNPSLGNNVTINPAGDGAGDIPDVITLAHEMAHWAYMNVLSNTDRMNFWRSMEKYFDSVGNFMDDEVEAMMPWIGTGLDAGHMKSPQEFFANQFTQWLMTNQKIAGDETFWKKVARYVENLLTNFTFKDNVDSDLVPLFEKILPDEEVLGNGAFRMPRPEELDTSNPGQRQGISVLNQLEANRQDLHAAMVSQNPDQIIWALDQVHRNIFSMLSNRNGNQVKFLKNAGKKLKRGQRADREFNEKWGPIGAAMWKAQKQVDEMLKEMKISRGFADENALENAALDEDGFFIGEIAAPISDADFDQHMMDLTVMANDMFDAINLGMKGTASFLAHAKNGGLDIVWRDADRVVGPASPVERQVAKKAQQKKAETRKVKQVEKKRNANQASKGRAEKATKPSPAKAASASVRELRTGADIVRAWRAAGNDTQLGKDLMNEYVRRTLTEIDPVDVNPEDIPPQLWTLNQDELKGILANLFEEDGAGKGISAAMAVLQRKYGPTVAKLDIKDSRVAHLVQQEAKDMKGISPQTGFPGGVPGHHAEWAAWFTHRDKDTQVTLQTLTYRLMNMMGKRLDGSLDEVSFMDMADIEKLTGKPVSAHARGVMVDLGSPPAEFNALRGTMRRIAVGMTKGTTSPMDLMHEIGHVALRTNIFDAKDIDFLVEAFRNASDPLAVKLRADNPSKSIPELAEEWFAEGWSQYATGRVAKGDIPAIRDAVDTFGEGSLQMRGRFSTMIDRLTEAIAYMVNGLLRRNTVRQMYRRLTFYGDMFDGQRNTDPVMFAAASEGGGIKAHMANHHRNNVMHRMSPERAIRVRTFLGVGPKANLKNHLWYHGTPTGQGFDPQINPGGLVFQSGDDALHGPGFYVTRAHKLAEAYSTTARVDQLKSMVRRATDDPEAISEADHIISQLAGENGVISEVVAISDEIEATNWHSSVKQQADNINIDETKPGDRFGSSIENPAERLAYLRQSLKETVDHENALWEMLEAHGVDRQPDVVPFFINEDNIFGFDVDSIVSPDTPSVLGLVDELVARGYTDLNKIEDAIAHVEDGNELYFAIVDDGLFANGPAAKAQLKEALDAMGYDGIRTSETAPYSYGTPDTNESLVVWNTNTMKHADEAEMFDINTDNIFYSDHANRVATNGELLSEWMSRPHVLDGSNFQQLSIALDRDGMPKPVQKLMKKIMRKEDIDAETAEGARRSTHFGLQIKSNARRLREAAGAINFANWLAPENGAGYHEKHAAEMASIVQPIHDMLNALPDAGNMIGRWMKRNKFWGQVSQPDSHKRIIKSLRRGDFSNLSPQERDVALHLKKEFAAELQRLRDSGISIGEIDNYFPQVWDRDLIEANPNEFRQKIFHFIKRDAQRADEAMSDDRAWQIANSIHKNILDENGVYLPANVGKKGLASDHEYQRMLRFTNDDLDTLKMEEFMVNDLGGIAIKYFDQMARKRRMAAKWGHDNHGFEAYKIVAWEGKNGIVDLLTKGKVQKIQKLVPTGGKVEIMDVESDVINPITPFTHDPRLAHATVDRLIEMMSKKNGTQAARDFLIKSHPYPTDDWVIRANAIVDGIKDFGADGRAVHSDELHWMDMVMKSSQRKPFLSDPFQSGSAAKVSKRVRNFNSVTLLGYTALTSIPDVALPMIKSGSVMNAVKGWRKWAQSDPAHRKAIRNIGVAIEGVLHDRISHIYGAGGGRGTNAFFNATLLSPWTQMQREVAGITAFESFKAYQAIAIRGMQSGKKNARFRTAMRFLNHYGLGHLADPSAKTLDDLTNFVSDDSIRWGINKFVNETIFAPNPEQIPMWAQGPYGSIVFQLKSFPLMFGRLGKDVLKEAKHGNYRPLAVMATVGAGMGMGALAIKDVVQMRGGEDEKSADFRERKLSNYSEYLGAAVGEDADKFLGWWVEGMLAMGGLGLVGELIFNSAANLDNGVWGAQRIASQVLGPTFGTAMDSINVAAGIADTSDSNSKERAAARAVISRIPMVGGNRAAREFGTDMIGGEAGNKSGGSSGGGFDSGGFDGKGFDDGGFS